MAPSETTFRVMVQLWTLYGGAMGLGRRDLEGLDKLWNSLSPRLFLDDKVALPMTRFRDPDIQPDGSWGA